MNLVSMMTDASSLKARKFADFTYSRIDLLKFLSFNRNFVFCSKTRKWLKIM